MDSQAVLAGWKRSLAGLLVTSLAISSAQAHFVWIHVSPEEPSLVQVYFGEGLLEGTDQGMLPLLEPLVLRQQGIQLTLQGVNERGRVFSLTLPGQPASGELIYGLMGASTQRSLLVYHARGAANLIGLDRPSGERAELLLVGEEDGLLSFRFVFEGQPVPQAEVVFAPEFQTEKVKLTTDAQGTVRVPCPRWGPLELRALYKEPVSGLEFAGESVGEVRHYATLAVAAPGPQDLPAGSDRIAWQRLARAINLNSPMAELSLGLTARIQVSSGTQSAEYGLVELERCRVDLHVVADQVLSSGTGLAEASLERQAIGPVGQEAQQQLQAWLAELRGLRFRGLLELPVKNSPAEFGGASLALGRDGEHRVWLENGRLVALELNDLALKSEGLVPQAGRTWIDFHGKEKSPQIVQTSYGVLELDESGELISHSLIVDRLRIDEAQLLPLSRHVRVQTKGRTSRLELSILEPILQPLVPVLRPPGPPAR